MKIVAINGSLRKTGGRTEKMIRHVFEGAEKSGAECKEVRLSTLNINRCIGCNSCQRSSDYTCVFSQKDDFEYVVNEIDSADVVMFCSPVYVFSMSSLMKTLLERFYGHGKSATIRASSAGLVFHDVDSRLRNKRIVNVVVADNFEYETVRSIRDYWSSYCKFMDCGIVGYIERTSAFILDGGSEYEALKESVLENLTVAGSQLAENQKISRGVERNISKRIIPFPYSVYRLLMKTKFGRKTVLERAGR